tara:strand:+ start:1395 stop:2345 length:951 start_codon:yes stop_codon:yes gene_type:complete
LQLVQRSFSTKVKNKLLTPLNYLLNPLENLYLNINDLDYLKSSPPVFIIGPPRSGTTVLYQLLCKHFNFGYTNNFVADWYNIPITATRLYNIFSSQTSSIELTSNYGKSSNLYGPNEFGKFWYRWFSKTHELKDNYPLIENKLRLEIAGLTKIHQKPMLFKNVINSMRINVLSQIFDNSIFIVLNRENLDIAQSILNARIELYNNKNHSWSVITSALQTNPEIPYYKQIVHQIRGVTSNINLARKNIGDNKFIFVDYKELCNNTDQVLKSIHSQLNTRGIRVDAYNNYPNKLNYSTGKKVSDADYNLLKDELEKDE